MSEQPPATQDQRIQSRITEIVEPTYALRQENELSLADAEAKIVIAKAKVAVAESNLLAAEDHRDTVTEEAGKIDSNLASSARELAIDIAGDQAVDPATKALYASLLNERSFSHKVSTETYGSAAYKARQALDLVLARLEPGAPVIHIADVYYGHGAVTVKAGVASSDSIVVTPPIIQTSGYRRTEGGRVEILIPDALKTRSKDQGLAEIETPEELRTTVITSSGSDTLEQLVALAEGKARTLIGEEDIVSRLETLGQSQRVAALLALHECGITIDIPERHITNLQATLIYGLLELASGRVPSEYEYRGAELKAAVPVTRNNREWSPAVYAHSNSLRVSIEEIGIRSIKSLISLARLDKETFHTEASKALAQNSKNSDQSIAALAETSRTIAALDVFVDSLYTDALETAAN